jgi:hypothetical protein
MAELAKEKMYRTTGEMLKANEISPDRTIDLRLNIHTSNGGGLTDTDLQNLANQITGALADPLLSRVRALRELDSKEPIALLLHIDGVIPSSAPSTSERLQTKLKETLVTAGILMDGVVLLYDWGTQSPYSLTILSELAMPQTGLKGIAASRYTTTKPAGS